jgi:hypothetical protein
MSRKQLSQEVLATYDEKDLQKEISKVAYQGLLVKSDFGEFYEGIALGLNKDGNLLAAAARENGWILDVRNGKKARERSRTRSKTPPRRSRSKSPAGRTRSRSPSVKKEGKKAVKGSKKRATSKKGEKKGAKKGTKKAAKKGSKRGTTRGSKKGSTKGSKKASKKGSKKSSTMGSKKSSMKDSKKDSKKDSDTKPSKKKGGKKAANGKATRASKKGESTGICRVCEEGPDKSRVHHSGAIDDRPAGIKICRMCKECAEGSNVKCRFCGASTGKSYKVEHDN